MTNEELTYKLVVAEVALQSPEVADRVNAAAEKLRTVVREAGPEGFLALALVGSEFAFKGTV